MFEYSKLEKKLRLFFFKFWTNVEGSQDKKINTMFFDWTHNIVQNNNMMYIFF